VLRAINPVVSALLRSPLHGVLSKQLFLLTYTGRRTGRRYTLPLGYMRDGDALLVTSQHAERKQWWRNLRGGAPVDLHLRGRRVRGRAEVVEAPLAVAAEVERLIACLGAKEGSARLYMALDTTPPPTREQLARALAGVVVGRVTPNAAPRSKEIAMSASTVTERPPDAPPSPAPPAGPAPTRPAPPAASPVGPDRDTVRKILLGCGVLSSALYIVLTSLPYEGYSPVAQNVSELLAGGAPTRPVMVVLLVGAYNVLVVALAAGVWMSPGRKGTLRLTAAMLVLYALLGAITGGIFNMDMRGAAPTPRGALHPAMTAVGSVPILASLIAGAFLHGRRFGLLSLATIAAGVVGGALTVQDVPLLEANLPTPWMGLKERVNIYAYMLWIGALALSLWRGPGRTGAR
jgi:deazaflavin-dependent oxidoreductase (nitroreductase family)